MAFKAWGTRSATGDIRPRRHLRAKGREVAVTGQLIIVKCWLWSMLPRAMSLIEYVPSREAGVKGGGIQGTPKEVETARETARWLKTPQGSASMEEVIAFVREMHRKRREELGIG